MALAARRRRLLPALIAAAQLLALPASAHRRVPVLHQGRLPACVAFASAAVAQYHGHAVDPIALQRAVAVTPAGVAYADVVAVLVLWGIEARLLQSSVAELRARLAAGFPLVVGQSRGRKGDHAIVLEAYDAQRGVYRVMDPSQPAARERDAQQVDASFAQAGRRAILIRP
jgi:ABC-type bacteriocin/lantibiotic exporter with double-glycine peptidase domain